MEINSQELGSPSFLIVVSSSATTTHWASESLLKPSLQKPALVAERLATTTARDELPQGTYALRSRDETASTASGFAPDIQGVPHSPQPISEAENMASLVAPTSLPPTSSMDSSSSPFPAVPVRNADGPKPNPTRRDLRCDTDSLPSMALSPPPRSTISSDYKSAAAEAISRFRPTSRDVIIGVAPHLFDERAKRPHEAPRSNVPLSHYNDRGRVRASPLRYTIDFDEEEGKAASRVKPKKSFVSKLAEDFVFGEDSSKSSRTRTSSSNLMGSHRASIIDINLDGPPKSKRTKSSPNIKVTSSPVPPVPVPEPLPSRPKRWSFLRFGGGSDAEKPKTRPSKPKVEEDCGICYPRCFGECGAVTFAKYDRNERRERRARNAKKSGVTRPLRDFRDSPEWKEFRETQGLANKVEPNQNPFPERPSAPRSKSEGSLRAQFEPALTVVKAVNDSPDSTPEDSPSSSSEDLRQIHGVDKDKFRWRSLPGFGGLMLKVKSSKVAKV